MKVQKEVVHENNVSTGADHGCGCSGNHHRADCAKIKGIVHFYNGRETTRQWIKEGKHALNWTRLSGNHFISNRVRLWLFVLAYSLGNFLRRLVLSSKIKHWSLRSLLVKLIKIGAKVVRHSRYVTFQIAEVAIKKRLFAEILSRIERLQYYFA
jgi:hypothetical protein